MRKYLTLLFIVIPKKNKFFILFNIISLLFLLFLITKILLPNHTYTYDGNQTFSYEGYATQTPIFKNIELKPGMYKAHIAYTADQDNCGYCEPVDHYVHSKALLSGFDILFMNKTTTDSDFWLLESTDTLEFTLTMSNPGTVSIQELTIMETNGL